jgi:hypothetical protein
MIAGIIKMGIMQHGFRNRNPQTAEKAVLCPF